MPWQNGLTIFLQGPLAIITIGEKGPGDCQGKTNQQAIMVKGTK